MELEVSSHGRTVAAYGCDELAPSLELALGACLAQLKALRVSATEPSEATGGSALSPEFASEEKALKLSLSGIIAQLQDVREVAKTRRRALFLAVTSQLLPLLPAISVVQLTLASSGVRAAVTAGGSGKLLIPHLDSAPVGAEDLRQFVAQIAIGSVRSLSLSGAATFQLLAERPNDFGALESLVLPSRFAARSLGRPPSLPALRQLFVKSGACEETPGPAAWLKELLQSRSGTLSILQIEAMGSEQVDQVLEAALKPPGTRQLVFQRCALPDDAVARICNTLLEVNARSATALPPLAVHFEDCELSELAEQRLLTVLEQCDGRCAVSVDGGTTRTSVASDAGGWSVSEEVKQPVETAEPSIAAELLHLRAALAERDARIWQLEQQVAVVQEAASAPAEPVGGLSETSGSVSMAELLTIGLLRLREEGEASMGSRLPASEASEVVISTSSPAKSRFGFALEDQDEGFGFGAPLEDEDADESSGDTHEGCSFQSLGSGGEVEQSSFTLSSLD